MCFFDKDDLRAWILDEEIFSRFVLSEKEQQVLVGHSVNGLTFKTLGILLNITRQRAQQIHARAVKKSKKQVVGMIKLKVKS